MAGLDLGKQIGPMPLGAWMAIVVGGLGIAWYTRNSGSGVPDEELEDGSGQPGVGDGSVGGWIPQQPPTEQPAPDNKDQVENNDQWYSYMMRELIARFNYDPNLVDSALRKYLAGLSRNLSVSEWVVIRAALLIMPPPNPIPAQPDDPSPPPVTPPGNPPVTPPKPPSPPKPPPAKPSIRKYTVKRGDNLWNISKKYYGNGALYGRIFNANRKGKRRADGTLGMISNPSLIHPGWVLHIP